MAALRLPAVQLKCDFDENCAEHTPTRWRGSGQQASQCPVAQGVEHSAARRSFCLDGKVAMLKELDGLLLQCC